MTLRESLENRIRGWIPKESIRISVQNSRTLLTFMTVVIAALIIPIFYLVIQATDYLGIFWPIIYLAMVLVLRYIIHKTGFKTAIPVPSIRAERILVRVKRIRIAISSGLLTAFGVAFAARLIIGQLSAYFWIPFVILTVIGALIGDSLWKILQTHDLKRSSK